MHIIPLKQHPDSYALQACVRTLPISKIVIPVLGRKNKNCNMPGFLTRNVLKQKKTCQAIATPSSEVDFSKNQHI